MAVVQDFWPAEFPGHATADNAAQTRGKLMNQKNHLSRRELLAGAAGIGAKEAAFGGNIVFGAAIGEGPRARGPQRLQAGGIVNCLQRRAILGKILLATDATEALNASCAYFGSLSAAWIARGHLTDAFEIPGETWPRAPVGRAS